MSCVEVYTRTYTLLHAFFFSNFSKFRGKNQLLIEVNNEQEQKKTNAWQKDPRSTRYQKSEADLGSAKVKNKNKRKDAIKVRQVLHKCRIKKKDDKLNVE